MVISIKAARRERKKKDHLFESDVPLVEPFVWTSRTRVFFAVCTREFVVLRALHLASRLALYLRPGNEEKNARPGLCHRQLGTLKMV